MKQKGKHKGLLCFLVVSVFVGGIAVFALHDIGWNLGKNRLAIPFVRLCKMN